MSVTGERRDACPTCHGGPPQKAGVAISDLLTGIYSATAILAALLHVRATGQGQHIDMALLDVMIATMANMNTAWLNSGQVPGRAGNAHQSIVPYQVFACADGFLILAVGNDLQFRRFCNAAGCIGLADDARFLDQPGTRAPSRRAGAAARGDPAGPHEADLDRAPRSRRGAVRTDRCPRRGVREPAGRRARPEHPAAARARRRTVRWSRIRCGCPRRRRPTTCRRRRSTSIATRSCG